MFTYFNLLRDSNILCNTEFLHRQYICMTVSQGLTHFVINCFPFLYSHRPYI